LIFSLEAAEILAKEGIDVEVIDLRSLIPLDKETIIESIKKTNKAIVVHEDKVFAGFGAELVAIINEEAFEHLDAPVKRVGATYTPVGFNRILERAILPNTSTIADAIKVLYNY
jgi:2-oxoisovalerate dehydrogenase E1 component